MIPRFYFNFCFKYSLELAYLMRHGNHEYFVQSSLKSHSLWVTLCLSIYLRKTLPEAAWTHKFTINLQV